MKPVEALTKENDDEPWKKLGQFFLMPIKTFGKIEYINTYIHAVNK